MINFSYNKIRAVSILVILPVFLGCPGLSKDTQITTAAQAPGDSGGSTDPQSSAKISMIVYAPSGSTIFNDQNGSKSFSMVAGSAYTLNVGATGLPTGATLTLSALNTDVIKGTPVKLPIIVGNNIFVPSTPGTYSFTISALDSKGTVLVSKSYQSNIACSTPTFTRDSLSNLQVQVSPSVKMLNPLTDGNLFDFAVDGLGQLNGMGPYLCSLDPNGVGIATTPFVPCTPQSGATFTGVYVNYFNFTGSGQNLNRNVGLIVKDSCNTAFTTVQSTTMTYTSPPLVQDFVWLDGQVSVVSGPSKADPRVDGVGYYVSNPLNGMNVVQGYYDPNGKMFTIQGNLNYGRPSSVNYGLMIQVGGFADNLYVPQVWPVGVPSLKPDGSPMTDDYGNKLYDPQTGYVLNPNTHMTQLVLNPNGQVDVSTAFINSVQYTTDQAGDSTPALSLTTPAYPNSIFPALPGSPAVPAPVLHSPAVTLRADGVETHYGNGAFDPLLSAQCKLSNIVSKVSFAAGSGCAGKKQSGDQSSASIFISGEYSCENLTDAAGDRVKIESGHFKGAANMGDNCAAGGAGGGLPNPVF